MIWYAHGDRAPSAKRPHHLEFYELCLDLRVTPEQLRAMHVRDRNWLFVVNKARKKGKLQIAMDKKLETHYELDL